MLPANGPNGPSFEQAPSRQPTRRRRLAAGRTKTRVGGGLIVIALMVGGCTSTASPGSGPGHTATTPVSLRELVASVTQDRPREGTRELLAGVTNNTGHDVRVSSATIRWSGFDFPTIKIGEPVVPTGQTAAFTIDYGQPHCGAVPATAPVMSAVVDGHRADLPLHVDMPGVLEHLRHIACAQEQLDAVATVSLQLGRHARVIDGVAYIPGVVTARRRPGSNAVVSIEDLSGSVLFTLAPREGPAALPARLEADQRMITVPVLAGSNDRCDGHSRSQSSQTFLLSVYVRRAGSATQRVITIPPRAEQVRLLDFLDRVCG